MKDGQIVEQGTHQELLEARGHYFDLYNSQFTAAIEEPEEQRPGVPAGAGAGPGSGSF
jgi:ATP-binding cassette, subfamily B, multidrug efflux pump